MEQIELTNNQFSTLCFYTGHIEDCDCVIKDKDEALEHLEMFMDSSDYCRIIKSDKKYVVFTKKCNLV